MPQPEFDQGAEEGILLALFQDPSRTQAMAEKGIGYLSFGVPVYRAAWEACFRLELSDRPIDELRLQSEMGKLWVRIKPLWHKAKGRTDALPWLDFLPKLHSQQINRGVEEAVVWYRGNWKEDPGRVSQYIAIFQNMISGVGEDAQELSPRPGIIYAENTMEMEGTPTGLPSLDRMLVGGFRPTELYLCSAPTKHGKTSMAASLASYQVGMGNNVIVFSLEMSPFYFLCRVICAMAEIEWKEAVQKKPATKGGEQRWKEALAKIDKHLRIYPPPICTSEEMSERIKWHMTEFEAISLVIIDHIGMVASRSRNNQRSDRWRELEEQAYALKAMAVERQVPVWFFSQMSAADEKELMNTGDLQIMGARGSAGIKHAADFAFLLVRSPDADAAVTDAILRKKLDRITGRTEKAVISHDPRYYLYYEPEKFIWNQQKEEDKRVEAPWMGQKDTGQG